jgi:hypothetical protein
MLTVRYLPPEPTLRVFHGEGLKGLGAGSYDGPVL